MYDCTIKQRTVQLHVHNTWKITGESIPFDIRAPNAEGITKVSNELEMPQCPNHEYSAYTMLLQYEIKVRGGGHKKTVTVGWALIRIKGQGGEYVTNLRTGPGVAPSGHVLWNPN